MPRSTVWHRLIPRPQQIEAGEGSFNLPGLVAVASEADPSGGRVAQRVDLGPTLARVNAALSRILGVSAPVFQPGDPSVRGGVKLVEDEGRADGYRIEVGSGGIVIRFGTGESLSAALAAIAQALLLSPDRRLPSATITDRANTEWRGMMLDAARHFFPIDSIERLLDVIWLYRLNRFHLHLTDDQGWRLPVEEYPLLTEVGAWRHDGTSEAGRYGGFYTGDELRALDRSASLLGITLVPEIDLPGHASAALTAYPDLGCSRRSPGVEGRWGVFDAVLCASRGTTYRFVEAVFGAAADLFAGPYLHIGGDEVPDATWRACPECNRRSDPYADVVRSMAQTVLGLGRRPIAWDEAANLELPRETIIVNWRTPDAAAEALRRGYDLILAPEGRACYLDHKHLDTPLEPGRLSVCTVADSASFAPERYVAASIARAPVSARSTATAPIGNAEGDAGGAASRPGGRAGVPGADRPARILGGQANLWSEEVLYHRDIEYMAYLRLAAIAQGLWSGEPAIEADGFFEDLEALRFALAHRGVAMYPGPFGE